MTDKREIRGYAWMNQNLRAMFANMLEPRQFVLKLRSCFFIFFSSSLVSIYSQIQKRSPKNTFTERSLGRVVRAHAPPGSGASLLRVTSRWPLKGKKRSRAAKHGDSEQSAEIQRENRPAQPEAGGGDGGVRGGDEGPEHHTGGQGNATPPFLCCCFSFLLPPSTSTNTTAATTSLLFLFIIYLFFNTLFFFVCFVRAVRRARSRADTRR